VARSKSGCSCLGKGDGGSRKSFCLWRSCGCFVADEAYDIGDSLGDSAVVGLVGEVMVASIGAVDGNDISSKSDRLEIRDRAGVCITTFCFECCCCCSLLPLLAGRTTFTGLGGINVLHTGTSGTGSINLVMVEPVPIDDQGVVSVFRRKCSRLKISMSMYVTSII